MKCLIPIPPGTIWVHDGVRIAFVEAVDGVVLRLVIEGTEEEFFVELADGVRTRPTIRWLLEEFAAFRLRDCSAGEATLSQWQGRYLGLDRAAVFARDPRAVMKYDIALAALIDRRSRNAEALTKFAAPFAQQAGEAEPSGRSVIRWMDNLSSCDKRIGAAVNRSGRERGRSPLPPIIDRLVHQAMALYHSEESIRKMDGHALVAYAWQQLHDDGVTGIGTKAPTKTTVVNRINKCENMETFAVKFGRDESNHHFVGTGESTPVGRPFELAYIDGTEYEQVSLFSVDVPVPSSKMKSVEVMDAATLFVFPNVPFSGPYRSEMGMGSLLGALTAPVLDEATLAENPMLMLNFGMLGRLRGDNDRAIIPPSAIGNLTSCIRRVELAKKYRPDEKANLENYFGWKKWRLAGSPGTVLSPRSRRKSIRRNPLKEATAFRADCARDHERLRLEWNDMGHDALGQRSPNDLMLEYFMSGGKVRFTPPGEIRRHLARTVTAVLTTDGVVFDGIRYRWNRDGITKLLSENHAQQAFAKRLEGTARCDVLIRAYDWNLDYVEVLNESAIDADGKFVPIWSDDPDYTSFLTRYEHSFHQSCVISGETGAQTAHEKAVRRGKSIVQALTDLQGKPFSVAKKAGAILEQVEIREMAKNLKDDPDLSNFDGFLLKTDVAGLNRVDVPTGPPQNRSAKTSHDGSESAPAASTVAIDWTGLDPAPRTPQQALEIGREEEDLDGGIDWSDTGGDDPTPQWDDAR